MATLEASGLIVDTGERVGRTKLIPIYRVCVPPETNGPENGLVSAETVPILRGNGPNFTPNGPENGLRTPFNPSLTKGEAPPIKKHPRYEREIRSNIATCEAEIEKLKMKHSRWDSMNGRKWDKGDYEAKCEQYQRALKRAKEELLACLSQ